MELSTTSLDKLLHRFSKLKVVIVGDIMLDTYLWGNVNRISPEAPVPVVHIEKKDDRPGGAANVAMNILSLGAKPILCSVVGNDEAGKSLMTVMRKNKLSTEGIIASSRRVTSVKTRVLSKSHQLLRYDSEITDEITKEDEQRLLQKFQALLIKQKPDAVIFEDYDKGVLTSTGIRSMISACRARKILTAVDPKKKNFFAYRNANVFKPNLRELKDALHKDFIALTERSLNSIAKQLRKKLPNQVTIITLSEDGLYYSSQKENGIITAHPRDIADVSGAGDTVIAAVTLSLAAGLPLKEAAAVANIAGGLVCEYAGVVPVTAKMLAAELA